MSAALIASALQLAPTVINGLQSVASDVETDLAGHASVVKTATDALTPAITSLKAIAASGAVGKNDAANITSGVTLVSSAADLAAKGESLVQELEAFFSHLF